MLSTYGVILSGGPKDGNYVKYKRGILEALKVDEAM